LLPHLEHLFFRRQGRQGGGKTQYASTPIGIVTPVVERGLDPAFVAAVPDDVAVAVPGHPEATQADGALRLTRFHDELDLSVTRSAPY
jgi:hypothetical protein